MTSAGPTVRRALRAVGDVLLAAQGAEVAQARPSRTPTQKCRRACSRLMNPPARGRKTISRAQAGAPTPTRSTGQGHGERDPDQPTADDASRSPPGRCCTRRPDSCRRRSGTGCPSVLGLVGSCVVS